MSYSFIENVYGPPSDAFCYGIQNDGGGRQWSAIAHTGFGPIGGKANRTTCYYPYGGEEHATTKFSWLIAPEGKIVLVKNTGYPPSQAVSVGKQLNENEEYFAAIAVCEYGLIPGKAKGNRCWYPYGGKEHGTDDFLWLVVA